MKNYIYLHILIVTLMVMSGMAVIGIYKNESIINIGTVIGASVGYACSVYGFELMTNKIPTKIILVLLIFVSFTVLCHVIRIGMVNSGTHIMSAQQVDAVDRETNAILLR